MPEEQPLDLDSVYVLTDSGQQQLKGGSTTLAERALRLLVIIDGSRAPLAKLAKRLQDVSEADLRAVAASLIAEGHIKPIGSAAVEADPLGALDFFGDSSADSAGDVEKKDEEFARGLEEAHNFTMKLRQQGYYVRIARRPEQQLKPKAGESHSILVVEDNATLASVVRTFLKLEGFTPRIASNREEFVAELRKPPVPDLMLLDAVLPDADGFDILARVRKHPALQRLPVILLTGRASKEEVMRGLSLGATGYVTKPFELDVLMTAIKSVLGIEPQEDA
jgi:CheY-like chemotaxis protein